MLTWSLQDTSALLTALVADDGPLPAQVVEEAIRCRPGAVGAARAVAAPRLAEQLRRLHRRGPGGDLARRRGGFRDYGCPAGCGNEAAEVPPGRLDREVPRGAGERVPGYSLADGPAAGAPLACKHRVGVRPRKGEEPRVAPTATVGRVGGGLLERPGGPGRDGGCGGGRADASRAWWLSVSADGVDELLGRGWSHSNSQAPRSQPVPALHHGVHRAEGAEKLAIVDAEDAAAPRHLGAGGPAPRRARHSRDSVTCT